MAGPDLPVTRLTLIGALREGLRWEEFVALYGRLILFWGRRDFGLQDCDAENLCQEVLLKVWKGIRGYDAGKGRFRNWLYACTRNTVVNLRRDRRLGVPPPARSASKGEGHQPLLALRAGEDSIDEALAALDEDGFAADELQQAVLRVRGRVQPATWKAFLLFEFFGLRAREISPYVDMKPAAVNQAVFRVRRLLRQALAGREEARP